MTCDKFICTKKKYNKCQITGARCCKSVRSTCKYTGNCGYCKNYECLATTLEPKSNKKKQHHTALSASPIRDNVSDNAQSKKPDSTQTARPVCKAYCDGSYNAETKTYGYGVVFFNNDEKTVLSGGDNAEELSSMRNVAGELLGAMNAMKLAIRFNAKKLILYFDYTGLEFWVTGKWQANNRYTQAYRDFMNDCTKKYNITLEFQKVKGHSGDQYNEEADMLAKKGAGV